MLNEMSDTKCYIAYTILLHEISRTGKSIESESRGVGCQGLKRGRFK